MTEEKRENTDFVISPKNKRNTMATNPEKREKIVYVAQNTQGRQISAFFLPEIHVKYR